LHANFKPLIVWLVLNGQTEKALDLLSNDYKVSTPKLKVGLPKRRKARVYGCYTPKDATISVLNSELIQNPFVILHEFYHHIRTQFVDKQHKGTEKNANKFAAEFLREYEIARRKQII
jgi:hypothetical protein